MRGIVNWGVLVAGVLLLAACGTPESRCKAGIADMKERTSKFVAFQQAPEVVKAVEGMNIAETQFATGNFEGCLTSLAEARASLDAAPPAKP